MKKFYYFLLMAVAAILSLGFVSCSEESNGGNDEDKVFSHSTLEFVCDYSGNFYELVDMATEASIQNGNASSDYTIKNTNGKLTVTFTKLTTNAKVTINTVCTRNTTSIDANKTYGRKESYHVTVTRHFTDGSTGAGGTFTYNDGISAIDKTKIDEYIIRFGTSSQSYELDAEGMLNY